MLKKYFIPVLITLLLVGILGSTAYAAGTTAEPSREVLNRRGIGQITTLTTETITATTPNGEERTITINEETKYRSTEGEAAFEDLAIGRWIGVNGRMEGEKFTAKVIILLPEDFEPGDLNIRRGKGVVTEVTLAAGTFDLTAGNGETYTAYVNEDTSFRGNIQSLAEMEVGLKMDFTFLLEEEGPAKAILIQTHRKPVNIGGSVVEVGTSSFTINPRRGTPLTILVDEDTKFRSANNLVDNMSDLQPEMRVIVHGFKEGEGEITALTVVAAPPKPALDARVSGTITTINGDQVSVETRGGETVTVSVTEKTRIAGPRGRMTLEDLGPGMRTSIGAKESDTGDLEALVILVGKPNKQP